MTRLLISVLFAFAVAAAASDGNETPPFKITTKRESDRVDVKTEPDTVVLRLHLA